ERALDMAADALRLGNELGHPLSGGIAMWFASMVEHGCGALGRAVATGERLVELGEHYRLPQMHPHRRAILGRSRFDLGHRAASLPMIESALHDMEKAAYRGGYSNYYRFLLAEALALAGRTADALDWIERCIANSPPGSQSFFLPEYLR